MLNLSQKEFEQLQQKKKTKYHSHKTVIDGISFDSKKEAYRYQELLFLEKYGDITDLQRQPVFELIPTQRDENGKILERKCSYIADFSYKDKEGKLVVEDVKSPATSTPQYRIKRKLMLEKYGIRIKEV